MMRQRLLRFMALLAGMELPALPFISNSLTNAQFSYNFSSSSLILSSLAKRILMLTETPSQHRVLNSPSPTTTTMGDFHKVGRLRWIQNSR